MSAPSAESQHQEAWPARIQGHLRESADFGVSAIKDFLSKYTLSINSCNGNEGPSSKTLGWPDFPE